MELLNADVVRKIRTREIDRYKLTKEDVLYDISLMIVHHANIGGSWTLYTYPDHITNDEVHALILTLKLYKYSVEHCCYTNTLKISW